MPARCWIAPEIPTATYLDDCHISLEYLSSNNLSATHNSGATTLPVCPTCSELSAYPASTAALEAPIAAPRASARGVSTESKFSLFLTPLPPETTLAALPRSGRSETVSSSEIHSEGAVGN